jgi:hypothetical protein
VSWAQNESTAFGALRAPGGVVGVQRDVVPKCMIAWKSRSNAAPWVCPVWVIARARAACSVSSLPREAGGCGCPKRAGLRQRLQAGERRTGGIAVDVIDVADAAASDRVEASCESAEDRGRTSRVPGKIERDQRREQQHPGRAIIRPAGGCCAAGAAGGTCTATTRIRIGSEVADHGDDRRGRVAEALSHHGAGALDEVRAPRLVTRPRLRPATESTPCPAPLPSGGRPSSATARPSRRLRWPGNRL